MTTGVGKPGEKIRYMMPPEYYEGNIDRKKFPYKAAQEFFEHPPDHIPRAYEYGKTPTEHFQDRERKLKEREKQFQIEITSAYLVSSETDAIWDEGQLSEWGIELFIREQNIKQKEAENPIVTKTNFEISSCDWKSIVFIAIPVILLIGAILAVILPLYYGKIL